MDELAFLNVLHRVRYTIRSWMDYTAPFSYLVLSFWELTKEKMSISKPRCTDQLFTFLQYKYHITIIGLLTLNSYR